MASDDQIAEQADQFSEVWDQAYRAILANRDQSEAQLPHVERVYQAR